MIRSAVHFGICVVVSVLLVGCGVHTRNVHSDSSFSAFDPDRQIRHGHTTRREILRILGPPLSVARRGGKVPTEIEQSGQDAPADIPAESYFELFRDILTLRDSHIVYYYQNVVTASISSGFMYYHETNYNERVNRLWILIDDASGIVEAHIYHPASDSASDARDRE